MEDVKEQMTGTPATTPERKGMSDRTRLISLVIGDLIVFLVFAAIGRRSHGEAVGLDALLQIVQTALPFAAGWFLVAPFTGAFRRGLENQPGKMLRFTLLSWIAGWAAGFIFRGIFVDYTVPPLTFAIVSFLSNAIFLLIWRLPFAWIVRTVQRKRA
jgi:hypothetical protein